LSSNILAVGSESKLSSFDVVWGYEDNKWYLFDNDFNLSQLESYDIYQLNHIKPYRGYWTLINQAKLIPYDTNKTDVSTCLEDNGWSLCSHLDSEDIKNLDYKIVWKYDRGIWKQKNSLNFSFDKIDTIENIYPSEGVWIKR